MKVSVELTQEELCYLKAVWRDADKEMKEFSPKAGLQLLLTYDWEDLSRIYFREWEEERER